MFTFTSIADQGHKFNESLISLVTVDSFKKPLEQAENVRYSMTVAVTDKLDKMFENFQKSFKV